MRKIVTYIDEKSKLWSNIRTRKTITPGNTDNGCLELSNYSTKSSPSLTDFLLMTSGFEREKRSDLEQNCYIFNISGTTLHGINVSLSIQELGVGTGQRLKKRYWFLWIKMDHCNISSCNYFANIEKLWSRWSSPWTKSSWSNETKAPGIT